MSTTYPSDLSEAEWTCVQRHLPSLSTRGRPRTHPVRRILDAIFYVVRTGCAWRYLPSSFPPWQTVFYHFRRFRLRGVWHLLYTALHRAERVRIGRSPDPSAAILDSQSVKTVEESAHICGYDAHKCIKGRKRHPVGAAPGGRNRADVGTPVCVFMGSLSSVAASGADLAGGRSADPGRRL
jgi:putative transposase